jgi:hypothetical protein
MRGGWKGLRYPGWEIVDKRWSRWSGTYMKLSFGGCFTKHPFLAFLGKWKTVFCDICNITSFIFFLTTISHNMIPREGFTLCGLFLISYARFKLCVMFLCFT